MALVLAVAGVIGARVILGSGDEPPSSASLPEARPSTPPPDARGTTSPGAEDEPEAEPTTEPTPEPINTAFPGLTTYRGNATRSYYGQGPLPRRPRVLWRYPVSGGLCSQSTNLGATTTWCGTGWTGQPNVIEHEDGSVEVRIGAYSGHYHFLDGETGEQVAPDLVTGDLAKGSATSDPDGYPLYYGGSRDNLLRVIATDRRKPKVLWSVNAQTSVPGGGLWNDDWDGAPLIVGDYLLEGGENSYFYVIRLGRGYDAKDRVTVNPRIVATIPGWDSKLLDDIGDDDVSIESSVSFRDGIAYFANSGGLVQGWDISDLLEGGTKYERVFRFWTGDDTDASVVIDEDGYLYVASELQRFNSRSSEVGQVMKLDPSERRDPLVWGVPVTEAGGGGLGGVWATPAIYGGMVYVSTNHGGLLGIDGDRGKVLWRIELPGPTWSSPVPIDGVLLQGDCRGVLHAYDIASNPRKRPKELWDLDIGGCIESTPAVWNGMIYVGTRSGGIYGIGDRRAG